MNGIKYSFILPIYKVEKYLEDCIKSILRQNRNDYEIILVDDGSPDSCPQICDEYNNYDVVKVIHKKNGGLCDARNAGLKVATGEYILFVDPDDFIEDNYLKVIDENIDNYDMLVFSFYNLYKNKKIKGFGENNVLSSSIAQEYLVDDAKYCGYVWNKVYKKEIIDKYNLIFDTRVTMSEDVLFTYQYIEKIDTIKIIDNPIINYRQRKSSIISKKIKNINAPSLVKTYVYIINTTKNETVRNKCKALYLKAYYKYNKYILKKDFDINLINSILKNDYSHISKKDKVIINMYKYIPYTRTLLYCVKDVFNKKFD